MSCVYVINYWSNINEIYQFFRRQSYGEGIAPPALPPRRKPSVQFEQQLQERQHEIHQQEIHQRHHQQANAIRQWHRASRGGVRRSKSTDEASEDDLEPLTSTPDFNPTPVVISAFQRQQQRRKSSHEFSEKEVDHIVQAPTQNAAAATAATNWPFCGRDRDAATVTSVS